jgi:hypothetical protein
MLQPQLGKAASLIEMLCELAVLCLRAVIAGQATIR